jgi:NDP-sugar pyrophosphorylase family protein
MLGQFYSDNNEKFNVVILAGGLGSRMGQASEHIPKALSKMGSQRAIDLIISKFQLVAGRFIVGTGWHGDLLESYIRGRFPNSGVIFSPEHVAQLKGNAVSLMYALDNVDSRMGTIVSFCDLLMLSNPLISTSALYFAHRDTKGVVGNFRHSAQIKGDIVKKIVALESPMDVADIKNGVIGFFVFRNTLLLKEITYSLARVGKLNDITSDIITRYLAVEEMKGIMVDALLEFGNEDDLEKARRAWESY